MGSEKWPALRGIFPLSRIGSNHCFGPFPFGGFGTCLEAEAVASGFQDVAVAGQPIERGCGHSGVAEDIGPFGEAKIGGDDDAGALVKLAQQVEQQGAARCTERQIAKLIEDD